MDGPAKPPRVSVYNRTSAGKGWCLRWRDPATGKQRQRSGYDSEEAAQEAAVQLRAELRSPLPERTTVPVGRLLAGWWAHTERLLAPSTVNTYDGALRRLFDEPIADADALTLTTADVNRWTRAAEHAPGTLRVMLVVLSAAFTYAVEHGDAPANPIRGARRPIEPKKPVVFPTAEDVLRLAMTAPTLKWRTALAVAAYCGLRQGELFALRWEDIYPKHIHVRAALSGSSRVRRQPKTEGGYRRVPLLPEFHELLMAYHAESGGKPVDLIWTSTTGHAWSASSFRSNGWSEWRETAGVSIQWRHLRHYYASTIAAAGGTLVQLSRWMGHERVQLTIDRYSFLFDEDEDRVMERLRRRIG